MDMQKHPPNELIQSCKNGNVLCFLNIHAETCLSFYFEVLYSWNESFFQGFEIQEKGGREDFEWANVAPPTLMRTAGFVRRMTWIFFFFLSFYFILFSTLADGWRLKQLEAHRKYSFMQEKNSFHSTSQSLNSASCWWSFLRTFVNCNCVNVCFSEMTISDI